jgi:hypothetical protein
MDNIDYFSSFPAFTNNKEYLYILEKVKEYEGIRQKIIAETQADCQHDFQNKFKSQSSVFGPKILESKTCKHCGFQPPKPEGSQYKICEICWGEMKYSGEVRLEGESWSVYKCTVCNHEASHT